MLLVKTLCSAVFPGDFREPGTSEKTTPEYALLAALSQCGTEREKVLENQPLRPLASFSKGVFLHQSAQYPELAT